MNPSTRSPLRRRLLVGAAAVAVAGGLFAAIGAAQPQHAATLELRKDTTPLTRTPMEATSYANIVKRVAPSVVKVTVEMRPTNTGLDGQFPGFDNPFFRQFFGNRLIPQQQEPEMGLGSGVIISPNGYIVTNNHVVENAREVKVTLADGHQYNARVVGRDPSTDIAVIKIDAHHLPAITFGSSSHLEVGDRVLAIGNPFGIGETVTSGIVSAKERRAGLGLAYEDFIQTDAAINPGNSGGALVDVEGRLVGINTAILSRSGGFQGIGMAVPADLVGNVADALVAHGKVVHGFVGIDVQDLTPTLADSFNLKVDKGALVSEVQPGTPASRAGLQSGDVITAINGQSVDGANQLSLMVGETAPGTKLTLDVVRNGQSKTFTVTTERKPGTNDIAAASDDTGVLNGVGVGDIDSSARQQLNLPDNLSGALVTSVDPNSAAAQAGIREGDVILEINRHKVDSAKSAVDLTEHATPDRRTLVKLWSHGSTVYVVVDESNTPADNSANSNNSNDGNSGDSDNSNP
ncbi:MAG TPA: trypsin-like peptidase domain-containing protein [Opitutaceae bacterium]|jgi:serine protease Do|nr:trypsin-like peptidase domain-containing protein [Opitutaceae bacterium]